MECLVLNTYTLNKETLKMLRAFLCPVQRPARFCPLEKGNLESEEPERLARVRELMAVEWAMSPRGKTQQPL